MPNIRLKMADDLLLAIPAHSFRLLETATGPGNPAMPDAKCFLLYDLGGPEGPQGAQLKTSPELVVEQVETDPKFFGRLVSFTVAGGGKLWIMPQHQNGVVGFAEPPQSELDELTQLVAAAEAEVVTLGDDESAEARSLKARVAELQTALENKRSFVGVHAKLSVAIPTNTGPRYFSYFVEETAEHVMEALEPTPRPRDVDGAPAKKAVKRCRRG